MFLIGSRCSALAMWQARLAAASLRALHPARVFDILGVKTVGDKRQDVSLSSFGTKGVFTKELDTALLDGRIRCAVHCVKDLPTVLVDGLVVAAFLERSDVEDAVVLHPRHVAAGKRTLSELAPGSVVGTSALRRVATLGARFPHLKCKDVRGNVQTRLRKLDEASDYDALILAAVGLRRCDLEERISEVLDAETFGYAVGQGALAVVVRADDLEAYEVCRGLNHRETELICLAERGLLRTLEGGCKVPIAVHTTMKIGGAKGVAKGAAAAAEAAESASSSAAPSAGANGDDDDGDDEMSAAAQKQNKHGMSSNELDAPPLKRQKTFTGASVPPEHQAKEPVTMTMSVRVYNASGSQSVYQSATFHDVIVSGGTSKRLDDANAQLVAARASSSECGDEGLLAREPMVRGLLNSIAKDYTDDELLDTSIGAAAARWGCVLAEQALASGAGAILEEIRQG